MASAIQVGSIKSQLILSLSKWKSSVNQVINRDVKRLSQSLRRVGSGATQMGRSFAMAGVVIGASMTYITVQYSKYESALADMVKVTDEGLDTISKRIRALPAALGRPAELLKANYQIISAGLIDVNRQMEALYISSMAAKTAHVDQAQVIKGLTAVYDGYEGQIRDLTEASDLLFTIERAGKTTFAEIIPYMGSLTKLSHDLKISQDELGAAFATITMLSGQTANAATYYQNILKAFMKPTEKLKSALYDLGIEVRSVGFVSMSTAIDTLGLGETLKGLKKQVGGSNEAFLKLFPNIRAAKGIAALSSKDFEVLATKMELLKGRAGATVTSFETWEKTLSAKWQIFRANFDKLLVVLGEKLAPAVSRLLNNVTNVVSKFRVWSEVHGELSGKILILVGTFGLFATIAAPALLIFGKAAQMAGNMLALMWVKGLAPILPFVAAIAAIGVSVYTLRALWIQNFANMQSVFEEFSKTIKNWTLHLWDGAVEFLQKFDYNHSETWKSAKEIYKDYLNFVLNGFSRLGAFSEHYFNAVKYRIQAIKSLIKGDLKEALLLEAKLQQEALSGIEDLRNKPYEDYVAKWYAAVEGLAPKLKTQLDKLKGYVSGYTSIWWWWLDPAALNNVMGVVKTQFKQDIDAIVGYAEDKFPAITSLIQSLTDGINQDFKLEVPDFNLPTIDVDMTKVLDDWERMDALLQEFGVQTTEQLEATIAKLEELQSMVEDDPLALGQIKDQLEELNAKLTESRLPEWFKNIRDMGVQLAGDMESAFSTMLQSIIKDSKNAKEAFMNFIKSIGESFIKTISDMIAKLLIFNMLKSVAGLGGGLFGGGGGGGSKSPGGFGSHELQSGTSYVPYTGQYKLHAAEKVIPPYDTGKAETPKFTNLNLICPEAIARVLAEDAPKGVIVNVITGNIAQSGSVRQVLQAQGVYT